MKVALIGYGVENQAVYRYFASRGVYPTICDQNQSVELPEGSTGNLGKKYLENLDKFDVIVRSVGIPPSVILDKNPGIDWKLTTAVNLFFGECRTPIIGVTGTKGKGTTSTLIHKILEAAGKKAVLAGNIGIPMMDLLDEAKTKDFVVLELSSFQLSDFRYAPRVAVCLMVVPEHLNWHTDLEDYKHAKSNLFRHQNSDDVAVFNGLCDASKEIASASPAQTKLTYSVPGPDEEVSTLDTVYVDSDRIVCRDTEVMKISEVKLPGRHNLENVCAAIAATWDLIDGNVEAIRSVVTTFSGLEYHLEEIRQLDGVHYINDSFSTTPETAIAAIKSFEEPKIMILGGSDKGIPFEQLADEVVNSNVKHVLAIGDRGKVIAELLKNRDFVAITEEGLNTMQAIVSKARELAAPGDIVLLSTGCASFDMFKDYKDRGKQFTDVVNSL